MLLARRAATAARGHWRALASGDKPASRKAKVDVPQTSTSSDAAYREQRLKELAQFTERTGLSPYPHWSSCTKGTPMSLAEATRAGRALIPGTVTETDVVVHGTRCLPEERSNPHA